jgi:hypothetical protein
MTIVKKYVIGTATHITKSKHHSIVFYQFNLRLYIHTVRTCSDGTAAINSN